MRSVLGSEGNGELCQYQLPEPAVALQSELTSSWKMTSRRTEVTVDPEDQVLESRCEDDGAIVSLRGSGKGGEQLPPGRK